MHLIGLSRRLSLIGVLAATAVVAQAAGAWAQGSWAALSPVPARGEGIEGMSVGRIGTEIIAAFGFDNGRGDTTKTRIYHIDTDTWTSATNGPRPRRSEGTAVTYHGDLYAIGGRANTVLNDVDRYDPASDTWASLPDMPTARAGLAAAVVNGAIYVIGGRFSGGGPCSQFFPREQFSLVERFDIATQTWTTVAPLPRARSDLAAAVVGGRIYVFGGCRVETDGSLHFLSDVDVYDPATDRWSTVPADMPTPRAAFYQVGQVSGTVYVVGGWNGGDQALDANEVYHTGSNSWSFAEPMLTPRAEMGVVTYQGSVYAVGGALPAFGLSSDANEVFTP